VSKDPWRDLPGDGWGKPPIDHVRCLTWGFVFGGSAVFWIVVGVVVWRWIG
jgi:hypothetical protein